MSGIFVNIGSVQRYGGQIGSLSRAITRAAGSVFTGAAAAYALRIPAGSTYSGSLVRVRRSSDNAQQDFGAVAIADANGNRWLDTVALLAFVGAGSGWVVTWYDQSGNGRHWSQASGGNQPRIVNAGVLDAFGGRSPTVRFDTNAGLNAPAENYLLSANAVGVNIVGGSTSTLNLGRRAVQSPDENWLIGPYNNTSAWYTGNTFVNPTSPPWSTTQLEIFTYVQSTSGNAMYRNGAAVLPVLGNRSAPRRLGAGVSGLFSESMLGVMSEVIIYATVLQGTPLQNLTRNQGTAFGITVP